RCGTTPFSPQFSPPLLPTPGDSRSAYGNSSYQGKFTSPGTGLQRSNSCTGSYAPPQPTVPGPPTASQVPTSVLSNLPSPVVDAIMDDEELESCSEVGDTCDLELGAAEAPRMMFEGEGIRTSQVTCQVCCEAVSKYRCPSCNCRTCGMECLNAHKK